MKILVTIGLILAIGLLIASQGERLSKHNEIQCTVYGYQSDCKTPLQVVE